MYYYENPGNVRFYSMFSSFLPTPIDSNFFDECEKWENQPYFVINETNT